jgi:hypothetical protein
VSGQPSRCEKDHGGLRYKRREKRPQRSIQPQKRPVIDNWGNSAGFHAARQDAQLPRLTVHWLSVTRATEGPLSEISGPYFSLAPAAKDIGHVHSLDGLPNTDAMAVLAVIRNEAVATGKFTLPVARIAERANVGSAKVRAAIKLAERLEIIAIEIAPDRRRVIINRCVDVRAVEPQTSVHSKSRKFTAQFPGGVLRHGWCGS